MSYTQNKVKKMLMLKKAINISNLVMVIIILHLLAIDPLTIVLISAYFRYFCSPFISRVQKFVNDAKAKLCNLSQKKKQLSHQKSLDSYGLPSGKSTESLGKLDIHCFV